MNGMFDGAKALGFSAFAGFAALTIGAATAHGHGLAFDPKGPTVEVLSDLNLLRVLNVPVLMKNDRIGVGYAALTPEMQARLSALNHARGRCGGFEVLPPNAVETRFRELDALARRVDVDQRWSRMALRRPQMSRRPEIDRALNELREENLREFVAWASSFPNRDNRAPDPNIAVRALLEKMKPMIMHLRRQNNLQVEVINHKSTKQQSVRVRIVGRTRPQEVVVLGGHFDSINQGWGDKRAPGADDNASGSSNLFEALRVIAMQPPPERTIEFYWYAGEESGLLGSAEIAKDAKAQGRQIIAVLQLDMTLHPGSGELVIANVSDYTSAWLREWLVAINTTYIGARLIDDRCGYACSDHASWYRQGFPTLMPFESATGSMNRRIHTANDVINDQSNFKHSLAFTKIAVVFAMELANSDARQPY